MPRWVDVSECSTTEQGLFIISGQKALHFSSIKNSYGMKIVLNKILMFSELKSEGMLFDQASWNQLQLIKTKERHHLQL